MGQESNNPDNNLDAVFHILHAGNGFSEPTQSEMESWVDVYGLTSPTLAAKDQQATLAALESRECTFLVRTSDMTILWKDCSCAGGSCTPSLVQGLAELDAALP